MEKNYKENEISENESENESQFQEKEEVNGSNKNKKTIKEILKPDLEKIIVFLVLIHITPTFLSLLAYGPYEFLCSSNVFDIIKLISPMAVFLAPMLMFGIFGGILYYFLHYLFACLIINSKIKCLVILRNSIKRIVKNINIIERTSIYLTTKRIFIYSTAIIIGIIIAVIIFSLQNNL